VIAIQLLLATLLPLQSQTVTNTLSASNSVTLLQSNAVVVSSNAMPVSAHQERPASRISQQDRELLISKGIDPDTVSYVDDDKQTAKPTQDPLKGAAIWMDNFMGMTNAMLQADLITAKKEFLRFSFSDKNYDFSGHFTVMLNTPRKHKNPSFGFGSPEKASIVMLENVGGNTFPLADATIWEKSSSFIILEAMGREWIHSGGYTISK
jgi:hypothetical protein